MIANILIGSVAILIFSIYCYASYFFLKVWRTEKSGTAHALFLLNMLMVGAVLFESTNMLYDVVSVNGCFGTFHDTYLWLFLLVHSLITLCYTRGCFIPSSER